MDQAFGAIYTAVEDPEGLGTAIATSVEETAKAAARGETKAIAQAVAVGTSLLTGLPNASVSSVATGTANTVKNLAVGTGTVLKETGKAVKNTLIGGVDDLLTPKNPMFKQMGAVGNLDGTFRSVTKVTNSGIVNKGGRFADLDKTKAAGEVGHHMPQNAFNKSNGLSRSDGPAIGMTTEDHAVTRTFAGKGKASMRQDAGLSARQRLARDIRDLRSNFGTKYNKGSLGAIEYAKTLKEFQK